MPNRVLSQILLFWSGGYTNINGKSRTVILYTHFLHWCKLFFNPLISHSRWQWFLKFPWNKFEGAKFEELPTAVLPNIQVFCDVTLCCWINSSLDTLTHMCKHPCKNMGTIYTKTECNYPAHLYLQIQSWKHKIKQCQGNTHPLA